MSPWYSLMLAFLWADPSLLVQTNAQTTGCALSDPVTLVDGLILQQVQDSISGTYTMKLTYKGGHSWIGIGINRNGRAKMFPADAVIGKTLEDDTSNVGLYHLGSTSDDASGVQPYSSNTFDDVNTSFMQTTEDGTDISVLQFTQSLAEMQVTPESVWIFAVGLPDNQWAGEHRIKGSFQLTLTECGAVSSGNSNPSDTQTSTEESSEDDLVSTESGSTESGLTLLESGSDYRRIWMAHGIILTIAWGVCAPLAIGASILRVPLKERLGQDNWFAWHLYLNTSTVLLTIIGFVLAVVAMAKEGNEHFEDLHHKCGLAIFILVIFQAMAGYCRPHLVAAKPAPDNTSDTQREVQGAECRSSLAPRTGDCEEQEVAYENPNRNPKAPTNPTPDPLVGTSQGKTLTRRVWEVIHRLLGMTLLGLAWFNCTTGIEAQVENFPDVQNWTGVFWVIIAGISGSIFLMALVSRLGKDGKK